MAIARTSDLAGACAGRVGLRHHGVRRAIVAPLILLPLFACGLCGGFAQGVARPVLTTCAEIRALPRDQAVQGWPVNVKGVVTLIPFDSRASFVVDDGTGIWVGPPLASDEPPPTFHLRLGDVVEVVGRTHEGHFAPTISFESLRVVGRAPLPECRPLTRLGPESGINDCQRATISGVVQAAEVVTRMGRTSLNVLVSTTTGHCNFLLYDSFPQPAASLVNAEVTIAGVFISFFNSRREFLGARIYSNDPNDLRIVRPADGDAFSAPTIPLGAGMGFSSRGMDLHRRRVQGTVTLSKPGDFFYIQDKRHALRINTRQADGLQPGDVVEAVGFFQMEHHRAEMREAVFRRIGHEAAPLPKEVTREQAFVREPRAMYAVPEDYDDFLVALRGRLVSVDYKQGVPLQLNVECDGVLVAAEFTAPVDAAFVAALRPESELLISGVCALTFTAAGPTNNWPQAVGLRLFLRGREDVKVIAAASWWTPGRLTAALGLTALVLLLALAWVVLLRRRVALRSAQLSEEMRARRDAAVEFETTLRERNRLAADLHDTTEQTLTGLAFQLEASEALHQRVPERSQQHLGLARQLLKRSREDLRRSIWNLRATPLEENALSEALREVAADRSAGMATRILVTCEGEQRTLPDVVAGNLLLLAQEGITNALKHAQPVNIELALRFSTATIALIIRDDGTGFDLATAEGPKDGHFGLQGMRERMKRLGGELLIESRAGHGTTITAIAPHEQDGAGLRQSAERTPT